MAEGVGVFELEVRFGGIGTPLLTNTMGSKNDPEFPVYSFLHMAPPDSKNMILIL